MVATVVEAAIALAIKEAVDAEETNKERKPLAIGWGFSKWALNSF